MHAARSNSNYSTPHLGTHMVMVMVMRLWLVHGVQQPPPPAPVGLCCRGLARSMAHQALPPLQPLLLLHVHGRHQQLQVLEGRRGGGDGQTA